MTLMTIALAVWLAVGGQAARPTAPAPSIWWRLCTGVCMRPIELNDNLLRSSQARTLSLYRIAFFSFQKVLPCLSAAAAMA